MKVGESGLKMTSFVNDRTVSVLSCWYVVSYLFLGVFGPQKNRLN